MDGPVMPIGHPCIAFVDCRRCGAKAGEQCFGHGQRRVVGTHCDRRDDYMKLKREMKRKGTWVEEPKPKPVTRAEFDALKARLDELESRLTRTATPTRLLTFGGG